MLIVRSIVNVFVLVFAALVCGGALAYGILKGAWQVWRVRGSLYPPKE